MKNKIRIIVICFIVFIGITGVILLSKPKKVKENNNIKSEVSEVIKTKVVEKNNDETETEENETVAKNDNLIIKNDYWETTSSAPQNTKFTKEETAVEYKEESSEQYTEKIIQEIPVVEIPVVETIEVVENEVLGTENQTNEVITTVSSTTPDFSSSTNMQAIKASADLVFQADGAADNEASGLILKPTECYVSYFGRAYADICGVYLNNDTNIVNLVVNARLNDTAWNCMSAAMSEIFPNGATLVAAARQDCESSNT